MAPRHRLPFYPSPERLMLMHFLTRIDGHVREQVRIVAHGAVGAEVISALQDNARTKDGAFTYDAVRSDVRGGVNFGRGGDDGGGVDTGRKLRFGEKQRQHLGERESGIRHADQNFTARQNGFSHEHGGRGAGFGFGKIIFVLGEGEVAGLCGFGGGEMAEQRGRVADDFSVKAAGEVAKGATHFTHWFQPMTGGTAEKHDSFFDALSGIEKFKGSELVQQEPDASSFPSGGIRSTFEARGYTAWDPTSPMFLYGKTLSIPTIFVSYTGETLDTKSPLLKALKAVDVAATKVCNLFDKEIQHVNASLGPEQEYFVGSEDGEPAPRPRRRRRSAAERETETEADAEAEAGDEAELPRPAAETADAPEISRDEHEPVDEADSAPSTSTRRRRRRGGRGRGSGNGAGGGGELRAQAVPGRVIVLGDAITSNATFREHWSDTSAFTVEVSADAITLRRS